MALDGAPPSCHGHGDRSYTVYAAKGFTPTIDESNLSCDDFQNAPIVVFQGPCYTDNGIACRLLWDPIDRNRVFGCCEVTDLALWSISDASTPPDGGELYAWWSDDALEYYLSPKPGSDAGFDNDATTKVALDVNGRGDDAISTNLAGDLDASWDGGLSFFAKRMGSLNDNTGKPDRGYIFKWTVRTAFSIAPGMVGGCDFLLYDRDDATDKPSQSHAFGTMDLGFNEPAHWGTCTFVDAAPPGDRRDLRRRGYAGRPRLAAARARRRKIT
jgi:hypothetical protein